MSAARRPRYMPWRDPLPEPGPVMVFSIDGVVATMRKFEPLLGDSFDLDRWRQFEKHYKHAALISRGARLVDHAIESGVQVVWSTTRQDSAAADTWQWLRSKNLPTGPIMTRHRIKDGQRPAVEVKLRQWFWWLDNYGDTNPVVAWVDEDDATLAALPYHGCPAWHPMHLQRTLTRADGAPLLSVLTTKVTPSPDVLAKNLDEHRPEWDARDEAFQRKRSLWWEREQKRIAAQREAQRQRQMQGRADADRRRRR